MNYTSIDSDVPNTGMFSRIGVVASSSSSSGPTATSTMSFAITW